MTDWLKGLLPDRAAKRGALALGKAIMSWAAARSIPLPEGVDPDYLAGLLIMFLHWLEYKLAARWPKEFGWLGHK